MADTNTLLPCHTNVIMSAEEDVADHGPPHDLRAASMKEEEEETFHAGSCGGIHGRCNILAFPYRRCGRNDQIRNTRSTSASLSIWRLFGPVQEMLGCHSLP